MFLLSYLPVLKTNETTTLTQQVSVQHTTSLDPINVEISYNWTVQVDAHKKEFNSGESGKVSVDILGGKARIIINNIPIIGKLESGVFDYEAGSEKFFNLTPTQAPVQGSISLKIKNIIFTNISTEGPASVSPKDLVWDKPQIKEFSLNINPNARGGDIVKIKLLFNVKFTASINISIAGFQIQLFEQELGKTQAKPEIFYEVKVASVSFDWLIILIILAVVAVVIAIVAWYFVRKKLKK